MIEILVTDPPDRDSLVAEVWVDGMMFCEVRRVATECIIEVYSRPDSTPWELKLNEFEAAIARARQSLA